MRISSNTRELLATIVCGDIFTKAGRALAPYRTLDQIITFFEDFGERDYFESEHLPSRKKYTMKKLNEYNGTESMGGIISESLEFWSDDEFNVEDTAAKLRERLQHDGYRLRIRYHFTQLVGDRVENLGPYFESYMLDIMEPKLSLINQTSDEHVSEQKRKCIERLDNGDFSGSITSSYTLIESTLKMILEASKIDYKITEGDIRVLYKLLQKERGLNPASEKIDSRLKPILSGLQNIVSGVFDVSNKAGDRHKRVYEPKFHHAQLAVNSSLILCDFLLESFAARKNKL